MLPVDKKIIELHENGMSNREIARTFLGKESRESYIRLVLKRHSAESTPLTKALVSDYKKAKILFLDIETAPLKGHLWSLWQNGIGLNQMVSDWYMLSFVAKWADQDEVIYRDIRDNYDKESDASILQDLWNLLDEADFVVGHNVRKFDIKKVNARFLLNGMDKPSTFRIIDTMLIAKALFGFTSNKLEYLTDRLCTKYKKSKHTKFPGHLLWDECLKGNPEAWAEMEEYNKFDVLSNQELYEIFMPWDSRLPNFDLYVDGVLDMSEWVEDGFHYTNLGKYQRYRHKVTGQQRRGRTNLLSKEKRAQLLSNILV